MDHEMTRFGEVEGKPVWLIPLQNGELSCEIITLGAAVRSLRVPDGEGRPVDVVLGFDTLEEYLRHDCYFGAVIGPVANRISGAAYSLNGQRRKMTENDGRNCNHSGKAGLDRRLWEVLERTDDAVSLICTHPNGFGGIPGDIRIAVGYSLQGRSLVVEYWAVSDRDTLLNLTNHSYFNLDGHDSGPVDDHRILLVSHSYTPTDARSIPTGEIRALAGTPMDLTKFTRIGDRLGSEYEQIRDAGGFDRSWLIDPNDEGMGFRPAATVKGAKRGLTMTVYTDRPCVQFYTGNFIPGGLPGKDGAVYGRRQGLCLETQAFPDAPNHPSFPPITLRAGKAWQSRTAFRFW